MSNLAINGINVGGQINELKKGTSCAEAYIKTQKDNIDQVYFEQDGKSFVVSGENLNLKGLKKGTVPTATLDGKEVNVKFVDNEVNSAVEGIKKVAKTAIGIGGGGAIGGGALAALGASMATSTSGGFAGAIVGGLIGGGAVAGGAIVAGVAVVAAGATVAGGAIYGATRKGNEEALKSVIK